MKRKTNAPKGHGKKLDDHVLGTVAGGIEGVLVGVKANPPPIAITAVIKKKP